MAAEEKFNDKADELKGRAKEATGAITDDESLKTEGKVDQGKAKAKAKVQEAADKLRDKLD